MILDSSAIVAIILRTRCSRARARCGDPYRASRRYCVERRVLPPDSASHQRCTSRPSCRERRGGHPVRTSLPVALDGFRRFGKGVIRPPSISATALLRRPQGRGEPLLCVVRLRPHHLPCGVTATSPRCAGAARRRGRGRPHRHGLRPRGRARRAGRRGGALRAEGAAASQPCQVLLLGPALLDEAMAALDPLTRAAAAALLPGPVTCLVPDPAGPLRGGRGRRARDGRPARAGARAAGRARPAPGRHERQRARRSGPGEARRGPGRPPPAGRGDRSTAGPLPGTGLGGGRPAGAGRRRGRAPWCARAPIRGPSPGRSGARERGSRRRPRGVPSNLPNPPSPGAARELHRLRQLPVTGRLGGGPGDRPPPARRARAPERDARDDRQRELHQPGGPPGGRQRAHQQVRRGLPRQALLRRLRGGGRGRAARHRPRQGSSSARSTPTCSRTPAQANMAAYMAPC